jgi:hypothetical protein
VYLCIGILLPLLVSFSAAADVTTFFFCLAAGEMRADESLEVELENAAKAKQHPF